MNRHQKRKKVRRTRTPEVKKFRDIRPVDDWKGKLKGEPAFVIANAPSLLRQKVDLLENFFTIGVNRILDVIDPTILFWLDMSVWYDMKEKIIQSKAIKVCSAFSDIHARFFAYTTKKKGGYKFGPCPGHLHGIGNTGALACQFAVALGCEPIIILGMDCKTEDGKTDHYGKNRYWTKNTQNTCYKGLKSVKKLCPVSVINCAESDLWKQNKLENILNEYNFIPKGRDWYDSVLIGKQEKDLGDIPKSFWKKKRKKGKK